MPLAYETGEEIRKGDCVIYSGVRGEIELVADPASKDVAAEQHWYVQEFGGGVLIREPKVFGRVFVPAAQIDGDLVFVSRSAGAGQPPQNG